MNTDKVKKALLPVMALATSFYYPFIFSIGLLLGYLGSKIYCKVLGINEHSGDDRKIFLDCGKWVIHFHHWIMGIVILAIVWIIDWFYLPRFFAGVICGVIAHDIFDYNDWYKVVLRKETVNIKK